MITILVYMKMVEVYQINQKRYVMSILGKDTFFNFWQRCL